MGHFLCGSLPVTHCLLCPPLPFDGEPMLLMTETKNEISTSTDPVLSLPIPSPSLLVYQAQLAASFVGRWTEWFYVYAVYCTAVVVGFHCDVSTVQKSAPMKLCNKNTTYEMASTNYEIIILTVSLHCNITYLFSKQHHKPHLRYRTIIDYSLWYSSDQLSRHSPNEAFQKWLPVARWQHMDVHNNKKVFVLKVC